MTRGYCCTDHWHHICGYSLYIRLCLNKDNRIISVVKASYVFELMLESFSLLNFDKTEFSK